MTTKEFINNLIAKGDKRSYNEIATDLQLQKWTAKMKHPLEYATAKAQEQTNKTTFPDKYLYGDD